jgi:hypothetical protein
MDKEFTDFRELTDLARERVQVGPPPSWIEPCPYHAEFQPKIRGSLTHLLVEQQVHAELRQRYVRSVQRLETMAAVQELSQWHVEFRPRRQSLVLHSLKIRRGAAETEHLALDRIQFLQREPGLKGFLTIDGGITLLLVVEDVSPGDTLEWSYTLTDHSPLMTDFFRYLFALPPGVEIGKYKFVVRHSEQRALKWKSSQKNLSPTIKSEQAEVCCSWFADNFSSPAMENCTPGWLMDFPWIQISDCPDWQTVARAVQNAWKEEDPGHGLTKMIEEIKSFVPDSLSRINRAIELVQDGFRYLSVNLELGGQIPASAETVIRRRYGDCKDKAFLLVRLLRGLGIPARPVLVNTAWQRSISGMLPSPDLFNHVIVEFEVENEKRWVDCTSELQGGGALGRSVWDFGIGLPIDAATSDLVPVPKSSLPSGSIELKESFILDTAGNPSFLAIVIKAKGIYANALRFEITNEGIEVVAKRRLQQCANRFSRATRLGQLQHSDSRETNEFAIAEVFEISGFLKRQATFYGFSIQSDATAATLVRPAEAAHRNPFVIPFPSNRIHTIELISSALQPIALRPLETTNRYFTLSRRSHEHPGFFSVTVACSTKADAVAPKMVPEFRKEVESAWRACSFAFWLPRGHTRANKRSDFGALPGLTSAMLPRNTSTPKGDGSAQTPSPPLMNTLEPPRTAPAQPSPFYRGRPRGHSSNGRRGTANGKCWLSFFTLCGALVLLLIAISLIHGGLPGFAGLILISIIPVVLASVTLASLGLRECLKQPGRYTYGRTIAVLMLGLGALFGSALAPIYIIAAKAAVAHANARNKDRLASVNGPNLLEFNPLGFVYHSPGSPWIEMDGSKLRPPHVVLMQRDRMIAFSIFATNLPPGITNAQEGLIQDMKSILRRDAIHYNILSEGEAQHSGINGWQMEVNANFHGHNEIYIDWVLVTNGFNYTLQVWGPAQFQSQVEQESDGLLSRFEITTPQAK